uniref:Abhydrolase domain-containing protein 14A n=1 Tax=Ascaris suum TaxID=6253 RepID=F1L4G9_ASCSU
MESESTSSIIRMADILQPIPDNTIRLSEQVHITEGRIPLTKHEIFFRKADPPRNNYAKGTVLFVHGQSYSSATWLENSTMQIFAAAGYRCFAIDLPGCGRTGGPAVSDCEKPEVLSLVIRRLDLEVVMVVGHSMAGQYIVPLLGTDRIICVVAIALSNTNMLDESASHIATPVLVVWGERDTSLGPSSASNLKRLPNARLLKIASGSHACYLSNPSVFQSACLNFFDLVRHYSTL